MPNEVHTDKYKQQKQKVFRVLRNFDECKEVLGPKRLRAAVLGHRWGQRYCVDRAVSAQNVHRYNRSVSLLSHTPVSALLPPSAVTFTHPPNTACSVKDPPTPTIQMADSGTGLTLRSRALGTFSACFLGAWHDIWLPGWIVLPLSCLFHHLELLLVSLPRRGFPWAK